MARMAGIDLEGRDPPACPLLGLAADRRSHFTYPHPVHRCFAGHGPAVTDTRRQVVYCLNRRFLACDRFRACLEEVSRRAAESGQPTSR
jgi:hypothetical protein